MSANPNSQLIPVFEAVKNRNVKHIFFVACGGSSALMYPSKYLMDRESKEIGSDLFSSNEFIHRNSRKLDENSLVILCSHQGVTPETVAAAKFSRSKGALTVSLTFDEASALAIESDFYLKYEWGDEAVACNSNYSIMYQLVLGVLHIKEGNPKYQAMLDSLEGLQSIYNKTVEQTKDRADEFAESFKDDSVIYTMASGANYGVAYSFSICILMEMQWVHSHAIHAGEYFHGPFEILDENVPFIILLGLDETRPLEERALSFSQIYGRRLVVLDAKDWDFSGVDSSVQGYIAPLVLNRVLRSYANRLAEARNHPLSTRRYMWKVAY